jgi:glucosamine--fructose-6-phosphate aminotransferase (isomerizing)
MTQEKTVPGKYTEAEILSQAQCWTQCLRDLEEQGTLGKIREQFAHGSEWLFVGCGSSFYLAQTAAANWEAITGFRAQAVPASELLLFPDLVATPPKTCVPVMISRSGQTSEVLKATEYLEGVRNLRTLGITCANGRPLEHAATATICLPQADEESTVMTRSFSSMLLALQMLAATVSNTQAFAKALNRLPALAGPLLAPLHDRIRNFVASRSFADYVYLGQGSYYGLACEAMLKLTEMSCSYAQAFHTLEFRHGPKAIIGPEVLVTFLISQAGYDAEVGVLEELKALDATTIVVTNVADNRVRAAADLLVELSFDVPEYARLPAYIFVGQMLGVLTGLKKGFNPDRPRHLTRVVMLDEQSVKPEHAPI